MARAPMILPPPSQVWLSHKPGLYAMARTSDRNGDSIRYVLGSDYYDALSYIERMVGGIDADPVSALVELRFALGDNGKRSIAELIEYARTLTPTEAADRE